MGVDSRMTVEQKLKHVIDLFFGMNPRNKFWLLEVLLLAKRGEIFFCNNEIEEDDFILCRLDSDLLAHTAGTSEILRIWSENGINTKYAVGRTTSHIKNLLREIESRFTEPSGNWRNIFEIKQMEPTFMMEIVEVICSLPPDWFKNGVGKFAEEIIAMVSRIGGKSSGEFCQPKEVTSLVMSLLNAKEGSVYNPYAGLASYGTHLNDGIEYRAQEKSLIFLIAKLNLLIHDKDDNLCLQGDSVTEWFTEPVDYIVASPPFNGRIPGQSNRTLESDFFARAYKQARKKVVAVVSGNFCISTGGESFALRKTFVEKDLVDSVVMLPENLFFVTNIPAFVIVLNKEKKHAGKIRFVNASSCFTKQGIRNILDVDKALSLFDSDDKYHTVLVDNSVLYRNACSFAPSKYIAMELPDAKEGEVYRPLSDILRSYPRKRVELNNGTYHMVSFPFNRLQLSINTSDCPQKEFDRPRTYFSITDDCLVIDAHRQLQSIFVRMNGTPAYVLPSYNLFLIDTSVVNPEYLVMQLCQPYMVQQIIVSRSTFYVQPEDLMSARILLPSLEEQKAAVIRYKEQQLQKMGLQLNDLNEKRLNEYIVSQRERKHAVGQILDDMLPAIELIDDFIHEQDSFSKDSVVSYRGATLEEYMSKLVANINKVSNMVNHFTDFDKFHPAVPLNLEESICAYIQKKIANKYEIILDYLEESEMFASISEEDLHQVFDNLINNAEKYGFIDDNRYDYKVILTISSSEDGQNAILHVRNNGVPASRDFNVQKIFVWGAGHGDGVGCNQAKKIIEHFGGSIEFHEMLDDVDGFVCDFEIVLPLINEYSND